MRHLAWMFMLYAPYAQDMEIIKDGKHVQLLWCSTYMFTYYRTETKAGNETATGETFLNIFYNEGPKLKMSS